MKFLDALKGILASSRAECKKSRACRAENIFVIDRGESNSAMAQLLGSTQVYHKDGARLPSSTE